MRIAAQRTVPVTVDSLLKNTSAVAQKNAEGGRSFEARLCVLLCLIGICLGVSACQPQKDACLNFDDTQCEFLATSQIDGARFDFNPPLTQSSDLWLKAGDQMKLSWGQYSIFYTLRGQQCDFSAHDPNVLNHDNCNYCTFCPWNYCGFLPAFGDSSKPTLKSFDNMFSPMAPQPSPTSIQINPDIGCACGSGYGFTPSQNTTYVLQTDDAPNRPAVLSSRVFVIQPHAAQTVTYEIRPLPQPGVTDATYYSGTVPVMPAPTPSSGTVPCPSPSPGPSPSPSPILLSDNFNTTLHITKVRVLKGQQSMDNSTGKLRVENASLVHPSRLVFIPSYGGDSVTSHDHTNRCYASMAPDGDFELTRCRHDPGDGSPVTSIAAVPTYLVGDSIDLLTWVVEFKPSEGGIDPQVADLFIEFTIEANN